jgi:lipid II:glycine glycyltransferase (peptidoglycan interpeptide bridge formation enzyme)
MEGNSAGYTAEVNKISQAEWDKCLTLFSDANINQCWGYGRIKWGDGNNEHVVLKEAGAIRSLAQVAIVRTPIPRVGIAYVNWGPLWKRKEAAGGGSSFCAMLEVLKDEYAHRRKLMLRIKPYGYEGMDAEMQSVLEHAGFLPTKGLFREKKRTILVNLEYSQEDMRKRLSKKWRNSLTNSEKEDLRIIEEFTDEPLYAIRPIYEALMSKKNFEGWNLDELAKIQNMLEGGQKMRITTCEGEKRTIAASVCSALGDTAIGLIGMTSDEGRKHRAYYLLQWDEILWAKKIGKTTYDLNGINPRKNPTVYHFKSGINGDEVTFLSVYDYCQNRLVSALINLTERVLDLTNATGLLGSMKSFLRRAGRGSDVR